jgi:hypothetical protein
MAIDYGNTDVKTQPRVSGPKVTSGSKEVRVALPGISPQPNVGNQRAKGTLGVVKPPSPKAGAGGG